MRTFTVAVAVAGLVAAAALPVAAGPPGPPTGRPCRFAAVGSGSTWTGEVDGGPVAAPGAAAVTLTCSIHVGNDTHAGAAAVTETSVTGPGVTALEPRPVTFQAEEWDVVVGCTAATVDGTTWYWDGGAWTPDGTAGCTAPLWPPVQPWPAPEPVDEVAGYAWCVVFGTTRERTTCDSSRMLDAVVCAALLAARPGVGGVLDIRPDGDAYVAGEWVWDCPPYGP